MTLRDDLAGLVTMKRDVWATSKTDLWATPQDFFDRLNDEFSFQVDVCATAENAKCARFFTIADDGLSQTWAGSCWMNPPYGRTIAAWMRKAYESSLDGATVVCLVPARTDTAWWHDYAMRGTIRFIRGRLKFGGHANNAPFPSAVVIFLPLARHDAEPIAESGTMADECRRVRPPIDPTSGVA